MVSVKIRIYMNPTYVGLGILIVISILGLQFSARVGPKIILRPSISSISSFFVCSCEPVAT